MKITESALPWSANLLVSGLSSRHRIYDPLTRRFALQAKAKSPFSA